MARRCTVCTHPKRDEVNRQLLKRSSSQADIAQRYGLSTSAIDRHVANHLKVSAEAMADAANARTIIGYASQLYDRANQVLDRALLVLETSEDDARSVQAAAASIREVRGSIELLAKLVVTAPEERYETADAWIDSAIRLELEAMRPPELPRGRDDDDVIDAEIIQLPEGV